MLFQLSKNACFINALKVALFLYFDFNVILSCKLAEVTLAAKCIHPMLDEMRAGTWEQSLGYKRTHLISSSYELKLIPMIVQMGKTWKLAHSTETINLPHTSTTDCWVIFLQPAAHGNWAEYFQCSQQDLNKPESCSAYQWLHLRGVPCFQCLSNGKNTGNTANRRDGTMRLGDEAR